MNFQNIPRDDKTIKRAIVPKLGALSFFDYAAIEPRLFAYYAAKMGHPELAEMVKDGTDPYTAIAKMVTQKDEVSAEERQTWKVFFLSLMYGAGSKSIREQIEGWGGDIRSQAMIDLTKVTKADAFRMIDKFHDNFPAVKAVGESVARVSARRGYIVGIDGRHLHPEQFGEHKMLNKLIQGGAAGIMKQAIVNVHEALPRRGMRSRIISVVHDELQLDGPTDEVWELHSMLPALMRHYEVNKVVPIEVDHEVSTTTWADKVPYDEWRASA